MYTLLRHFRLRDAAAIEFPYFAVSLLLAELFYKRVYGKAGESRSRSLRCCGIPGRLGVATPPDEVEQPRNSLHDKVTEALLDIAKNCGDNVKDLDAANGVFNGDPLGTDLAVLFLLFGGPLFAPGLLGGLLNGCAFGSIALEALVLKHRTAVREGIVLLIDGSLVVFAARLGCPQAQHLTGCLFGEDDVLLGVALLLAAVLFPAIFAVLRTADRPFRAVEDELQFRAGFHQFLRVSRRSPGQFLFISQGLLDNRSQAMNPLVRLPLADTEQEPQHFLRWVVPEIEQDEEQLVFIL